MRTVRELRLASLSKAIDIALPSLLCSFIRFILNTASVVLALFCRRMNACVQNVPPTLGTLQ